jgi:hypothetical protein
MRVWLKEWSPLLAALLVVLSIFVTGKTMRTSTASLQARLTDVEKNIASIRNVLEGNQGVIARITTLEVRLGDKLQNLIVQRDNALEQTGQELFNIQEMRDAFQTLKNNVDTIMNVTQRIEYIEEMLLDVQGTLEEMKKQWNAESQ